MIENSLRPPKASMDRDDRWWMDKISRMVKNLDESYPQIVDTISLTAQGADIADTAFLDADAPGIYRVSYSLFTTVTAGGAGKVDVKIKYSALLVDAQVVTSALADLTVSADLAQGSVIAHLGAGSVTYGTTHTGAYSTAKYGLYVVCERLA